MNRNIKLVIVLLAVLLVIFSVVHFTGNSNSSEKEVVGVAEEGVPNNDKVAPEGGEDMGGRVAGGRPIDGNKEFPLEAIEVCEGLEEGNECSVETPEGEKSGTCILIDEELVCQFDRAIPQ